MKFQQNPHGDVLSVIDTLQYVRRFSNQKLLVKLGGSALKDLNLVKTICDDLALIRSIGISVVLVHGGGPSISDELSLRGIHSEFIDGQRVTTPEMMDIIEMVLCGKMNRRIVRTLNAAKIKAVGLCGTDANMIQCRREDERLQNVGIVERIDTEILNKYLGNEDRQDIIPVVAPMGVDEMGRALNVNADWAASRIAQALNIKKMIYLTDQDGILDKQGSLISELDAAGLEELMVSGVVTGGMLAKTRTILHALRNKVDDIHIINSKRPHSLIEELFTNRGIGTVCHIRACS
ncbi:MAG: acetylglutamate kinase [Bdellovibrionales bacterium]|nr:acetylglutamate kinase [Bdellovibrionales bacterium]